MSFIVVCQSAWMNESGSGISYNWDGEEFETREAAIGHGFTLDRSDDFNVAEINNGSLTWWGWMDERIDENEDDMRAIADALGLVIPA